MKMRQKGFRDIQKVSKYYGLTKKGKKRLQNICSLYVFLRLSALDVGSAQRVSECSFFLNATNT